MSYHFAQLRALWISAGGAAKEADAMAAIAMAESNGRLADHNARDPYGGSWCAWQINGVHPFYPQVLTHDPYYCALAAVYVHHRQGLNAWATHRDGQFRAFLPSKRPHAAKPHDNARRHIRRHAPAHHASKHHASPHHAPAHHASPHHAPAHTAAHRVNPKPIADLAPGEAMNHIDIWFVFAAAFFALWRLEAASEKWYEINAR